MAAMEKIDWSDCPRVEVKPGVHSGAPCCAARGCRRTPLSTTSIMGSAPRKLQNSLKSRPNESRRF